MDRTMRQSNVDRRYLPGAAPNLPIRRRWQNWKIWRQRIPRLLTAGKLRHSPIRCLNGLYVVGLRIICRIMATKRNFGLMVPCRAQIG